MVVKLSKILIKPALQNHILNVSLVSNKAPNLHSVICSEMIITSITNRLP